MGVIAVDIGSSDDANVVSVDNQDDDNDEDDVDGADGAYRPDSPNKIRRVMGTMKIAGADGRNILGTPG